MFNKFHEMSHKFCSRTLNFSSEKVSDVERDRFNACMTKYQDSFKLYEQEQNRYFDNMDAIDAVGGDKYAMLNQYDKF